MQLAIETELLKKKEQDAAYEDLTEVTGATLFSHSLLTIILCFDL
jgi:hypothetical protein